MRPPLQANRVATLVAATRASAAQLDSLIEATPSRAKPSGSLDCAIAGASLPCVRVSIHFMLGRMMSPQSSINSPEARSPGM
ncbi:hypothetical protein MPRG_64030 [Mycobacterium paragordonae]|uniref:Uncharacterized protein n=1 Tax=Mycobacterium paragordonae TaxID=1389713 RepID=A0ABQ1CFW8_9MYCO|nr:hypothetical protein MPRG_64030 [Mycobacterium paragordonae]